jgi:hypothetical protein
MAAGGQNDGFFRRRFADRFLLSGGIFVPKGMFVAFVVSSQIILLHTYIHPSIHTSVVIGYLLTLDFQLAQWLEFRLDRLDGTLVGQWIRAFYLPICRV